MQVKCKRIMQKKYLTFIFIATIFHQGWTLKCYECFSGPNCGDPFNPAYQLEKECTSSTACIKRQYTEVGTGDIFAERFCYGDHSPTEMSCEEFLAVQNIPGVFSDVKCYQCNEDLCNSLNGYEGPLTTTLEATSSNFVSSIPRETTPWYYSTSTPRNTPGGENTTWNYWYNTTTSRPSKTTSKYDRTPTTSRWPIRTTTRTTRKYYSRTSPAPFTTSPATANNKVEKPLTIINILYGTFNFQNLNIMPNNNVTLVDV